jgi:hypothetical protein
LSPVGDVVFGEKGNIKTEFREMISIKLAMDNMQ